MFLSGDDETAKGVVSLLIRDAGFEPVDLGGFDRTRVQEPPRRKDGVFGDEYRLPAALELVAALNDGTPFPATPKYA